MGNTKMKTGFLMALFAKSVSVRDVISERSMRQKWHNMMSLNVSSGSTILANIVISLKDSAAPFFIAWLFPAFMVLSRLAAFPIMVIRAIFRFEARNIRFPMGLIALNRMINCIPSDKRNSTPLANPCFSSQGMSYIKHHLKILGPFPLHGLRTLLVRCRRLSASSLGLADFFQSNSPHLWISRPVLGYIFPLLSLFRHSLIIP